MSYARKTGYSGGGDLPRGARVFELKKGDGSFMHGSSYVVDDNGETNVDMDVREPPTFQFSHQKECSNDRIVATLLVSRQFQFSWPSVALGLDGNGCFLGSLLSQH